MRLPYLRSSSLDPTTQIAPLEPCVVRPYDYRVIDGDTIWVMAPPNPSNDGKRDPGFSIRFRSVSAPEKSRKSAIETFFKKIGAESDYKLGDEATDFLRNKAKGRLLLIVPSVDQQDGSLRRDKYNRVLADVYLSGDTGKVFDVANAICVPDMMLEKGYASTNPGEEPARSRAKEAILQANPGAIATINREESSSFDDPDL